MSKIRQSPKQAPERRRHQLLSAAQKLFAKKGYRGTTVDEIAHKAGLTKGAFYYHVLLALVDEVGREYHEGFHKQIQKGDLSPVGVLDALINVHESRDLAKFLNMVDLWLQAQRSPAIKKSLEKHFSDDLENVVAKMDRAYGQTTEERRKIAMFTFCFYSGLAALKCLKYTEVDVEVQKKLFARFAETVKRKPSKQ
jgi:AcrR family transcriptional regulator